jgi:hypothetical protein
MALTAGVDVPELAANANLPPIGSSLAAFIAALEGTTVDSCGGFPAGQCTALACAWCRNLGLGTPCDSCAAPHHCDGACWAGGSYPGFTWIPNTPSAVPVPGDVVAYHANCSADSIGSSGHVGVFVDGDALSFTGFDQNWNGAYCRLIHHGYECVAGWHHPDVAVTDPCHGITCGPCQECSDGVCVDTCPAGYTCVSGICTSPVSPPPMSSGAVLAAGLVLVGGLATLAILEARRHPKTARAVVGRLEGPGATLGVRGGADSAVGRPARRNAVNRAPRVVARRAGVPVGESFGAGLGA